ncbi:helicase [Thecamonas trahens ATCC 50062]|uniref:DNA 3'-5' helicase n=1 Tax=Thecamonas trahens ATCC 50062 TaxID=461836 RepID=A0A0L0D7S6_THETB|nr:helicase [Thecamonas trahens ATCC 50062]KNC48409.1 helicase [Thecamonas trahens ATCC 50062]|eukprot:XP_013758526.1 helicase [Thecamonas trahens ATCC 50062]
MLSEELRRLKRVIKDWEYSFFAEHERTPSVADIRANRAMADKYKMYKRLKRKLEPRRDKNRAAEPSLALQPSTAPLPMNGSPRKSALAPLAASLAASRARTLAPQPEIPQPHRVRAAIESEAGPEPGPEPLPELELAGPAHPPLASPVPRPASCLAAPEPNSVQLPPPSVMVPRPESAPFTIIRTTRSLSASSWDSGSLLARSRSRDSLSAFAVGLGDSKTERSTAATAPGAALSRPPSTVPLKSLAESLRDVTERRNNPEAASPGMDSALFEYDSIQLMYAAGGAHVSAGSAPSSRHYGREGRKRNARSRGLRRARELRGAKAKAPAKKAKASGKSKAQPTPAVASRQASDSESASTASVGVADMECSASSDAVPGLPVAEAAPVAGVPVRRPIVPRPSSRVGRMRNKMGQDVGEAAEAAGVAKTAASPPAKATKSKSKPKLKPKPKSVAASSSANQRKRKRSAARRANGDDDDDVYAPQAKRKSGFAKVRKDISKPTGPKSVSSNFVAMKLNKPGERRGVRKARGRGVSKARTAQAVAEAASAALGGDDAMQAFDSAVADAIGNLDSVVDEDADAETSTDASTRGAPSTSTAATQVVRGPAAFHDDDSHPYAGGMTARARGVVAGFRAGQLSLEDVATSLFGFEGFRPGQREAVERVLGGKSTLVVLPTGSGKSSIYQLPAFLVDGVVLVVTPLVSLMADQLSNLPPDLIGATINSTQSYEMRKTIEAELKAGRISILFVSPELLETKRFRKVLAEISVAFVAIDEAHCVSEWSHNFRPAYLRLHQTLASEFGVTTFLGLTATATAATVDAIVDSLSLDRNGDPGCVISSGRVPSNLQLSASVSVMQDLSRVDELAALLKTEPFAGLDSIIVYCGKRRTTEEVAARLNSDSISAECYHAGMEAKARARVQRAFMLGRVRIMVATVAFGMGVNKADVRAIIHYNMPRSIENYVQEIGRGGRDGKPCYCHVFLHDSDYIMSRSFAYADSVDPYSLRALLRHLFGLTRSGKPTAGAGRGPATKLVSLKDLPREMDVKSGVIATVLAYLSLPAPCGVAPRPLIALEPGCHKSAKVWIKGNVKRSSLAAASTRQAVRKAHAPGAMTNAFLDELNGEVDAVTAASLVDASSGESKHAPLIRAILGRDTADSSKWVYNVDLEQIASSLGREPTEVSGMLFAASMSRQLKYELSDWCSAYRVLETPTDVAALAGDLAAMLARLEAAQLNQLNAIRRALETFVADSDEAALRTTMTQYFASRQKPSTNAGVLLPRLQLEQRKDSAHVRADIKVFLRTLDGPISARAVARILHGIPSPAYPVYEWSNNHFWGRHINVEFSELMKAARAVIRDMLAD